MAAKNRYVNTSMWVDTKFTKLTPNEKLVFIYLFTNSACNIAGMYQIPLHYIVGDTGLSEAIVSKALLSLEEKETVLYRDGWIILKNSIAHQKMNPKVASGIISAMENVPEELLGFVRMSNKIKEVLINNGIDNSLLNAIEDNQSLYIKKEDLVNPLRVPIVAKKDPKEGKIDFNIVWDLYDKKKGKISDLEKKWYSLSKELQEKIIESIPAYVASTPDKQFRQHFSTYLSKETWTDEIIDSSGRPQTFQESISEMRDEDYSQDWE